MRLSVRIATFRSIDIKVHASLCLAFLWAIWYWGVSLGLGVQGALFGLFLLCEIFVCVIGHELAHGYHHRFLPAGYENPEIATAYDRAKAGGSYDKVECWHGDGRSNTHERAYAISNPMEYFAESTEAFFAHNDFFPFNRAELKKHDPAMEQLVAKLWGVDD